MKSLKGILLEGLIRRQSGMDMRAKIEAWLDGYIIKNYTINDDFTIDVKGYVDLTFYKEEQLPKYIQFGIVTGDFSLYCSNALLSLKGCPQEVRGNFDCGYCKNLKSLEGCPQKVSDDFACEHCGKKFTEDDVKKYCNVKKEIYV